MAAVATPPGQPARPLQAVSQYTQPEPYYALTKHQVHTGSLSILGIGENSKSNYCSKQELQHYPLKVSLRVMALESCYSTNSHKKLTRSPPLVQTSGNPRQ